MTPGSEELRRVLATDDAVLDAAWTRLATWLQARFGREASLEAALFLVGIQERAQGFTDRLKKEEKQALIMLGTWVALERVGLARRDESSGEWERTVALPVLDIMTQEKVLRAALVRYFETCADLPAVPTHP